MAIDDGRIRSVGSASVASAANLGRVAILPALVNAHTHLELSYLHGRVPPGRGFNDWVRTLMALRRSGPDSSDPLIIDAARAAIQQARAAGTGLFGDVTNTLVTAALFREAGVAAQVFHELTGFNVADPHARVRQARARAEATGGDQNGVRISIAPHAPYSVSPELFMAVRSDLDAHTHSVSSVHLCESADEVELIRHGTGAARSMLEDLGAWTDEWRVPGVSPVTYLSNMGFLDSRTLVVHGVQFDADDLRNLKGMDATVVSCPRSNRHVGVGSPPLEAFVESGVNLAFGTDSLASVGDLNMFAELAEARRLAPRVPARRLLEIATLGGARALGFQRDYGTIEPGKEPALITVRIPEGVSDVEEYLVSGVEPDAITWLDSAIPHSQRPMST